MMEGKNSSWRKFFFFSESLRENSCLFHLIMIRQQGLQHHFLKTILLSLLIFREINASSVNRLTDYVQLNCCDEVLLTSSGPGEEYQNDRLGVYKAIPGKKFNDKPLYKQVDGDDFIYFWIWDDQDGSGHNWLVR